MIKHWRTHMLRLLIKLGFKGRRHKIAEDIAIKNMHDMGLGA